MGATAGQPRTLQSVTLAVNGSPCPLAADLQRGASADQDSADAET